MKSPDQLYGPLVGNLLHQMAQAIQKECGATGVRITCEFVLKESHGDLKIQSFTTPDAKTERLLDPDNPMPRGSKLQRDVGAKVRSAFATLRKFLGG